MILCRTPLRISFVGGGTDVPAFYQETPGAVLSTTIDRYLYVNVKLRFDARLRVSYSRNELVERPDQIQHDLVREALARVCLSDGLEITMLSDVPAEGTGLGSSSSCAVGLLNAFHRFRDEAVTPEALAREACELEIDQCHKPIGKQDQYNAAYGGLNLYRFLPDGQVIEQPLCLTPALLQGLQANLLLFYTGLTRSADPILAEQQQNLRTRPACRSGLERMAELAYLLARDLRAGCLDSFGPILDEAWQRKRELASGITSPQIDGWYAAARNAGARGGKLLGAGGGGFLLFYVPPDYHGAVRRALSLPEMSFAFESEGSQIVYRDPERRPVCMSC